MKNFKFNTIKNIIKKNNERLADLIFLLIIFFSLYLGILYSTYHTDPWHWGIIVGKALDYINGFKLYKEIYILYGPGIPILFEIIDLFYSINYYTVGVITSVIYCLNLIFIYLISLKLSNRFNALIIVLIFFSFSHYPQTPWPDFYAGLCILISIFFLISYQTKQKLFLVLISSFLLSLTVVFRSTYLLSILATILLYFLSIKFFKISISIHIKKYFAYVITFLITYLFFLLYFGNTKLFFEQSFFVSYQLIEKHFFVNYDISYLYLIIKFFFHFFFPKKLENFYFSLLVISNFVFIIYFLKNKIVNIKELESKNIILYLVLGITGLIQALYQYEIYRISLSCVSMFFILLYFIDKVEKKKIIYVRAFFFILIIPLFPKNIYETQVNIFPTIGYVNKNNEHIKDENIFFQTNIKFFGNHKFNIETINYYAEMKKILCNYDTIINYSIDRTLIYICDKKNLIPNPANTPKPFYLNKQLEKNFKTKNLNNNEIIIADKNFYNPNLLLLKKIKLPLYTRYTKSDLFRQHFDNYLYIYIKK